MTNWNWRYGIFQPREEYVIDTDYENYAILFGCDRLWLTSSGVLVNNRLTYLSRDKLSNHTYISKATKFIDDLSK